jgi:G3E family GTPase
MSISDNDTKAGLGAAPPLVMPNARADAAATWQMLLGIAQAARMMPERRCAAPGSIPFTLVTGFLGAGKTTLVNHLLGGTHGRRLAVIVNDFGAINIDASLIASRFDNTISLTNGCACCSIASGLTETLLKLTEQPEPPEAILLEASGVAEPQPILHIALTNPALALNGVLALIDTETVLTHAGDASYGTIVERQVSGADLVVLNKTDLASDAMREAVRSWVAKLAPSAGVIETIEARVPIEIALGQSAARASVVSGDIGVIGQHPFQSWSFVFDTAFSADRLRGLAEQLPRGILRAKGTFHLADTPDYRQVFQLVGRRWRLQRDTPWESSRKRSEIVFIGTGGAIAEDDLRRYIEACVAS